MAKFLRHDVYVFLKLIRALFANTHADPKIDTALEQAVSAAANQLRFVPADRGLIIRKCVQNKGLQDVRESVLLPGPAGCGKTSVWPCLQQVLHLQGDPCTGEVLNPKAVTSNELYGYVHEETRERRDGLLGRIF